jgi:hypothetical protein
MKKMIDRIKQVLRDLPTTFLGVVIIALAIYGFIALGHGLASVIEGLLIGAGFLLAPKPARDIIEQKIQRQVTDTKHDIETIVDTMPRDAVIDELNRRYRDEHNND